MTLRHFIERPVLASVISIVIVIAGLIGLATLPIEQYPDIAPPTVMVHASYPGASAETIQKPGLHRTSEIPWFPGKSRSGSAEAGMNSSSAFFSSREV